jgi:threonine synthase
MASHGLLPEAASATTVASVVQLAQRGHLAAGSTVVCVMTGTAAKWPDLVSELIEREAPMTELPASANLGATRP